MKEWFKGLSTTGRIALAIGVLAALSLLILISTHLWWTEHGYCWGTFAECID